MSLMLNLPSLHDTFGSDKMLMHAFKEAGIIDIVPAMLLPEGSLSSLYGIGPKTEKRVTAQLREVGIERRTYAHKLRGYIGERFGGVPQTPLSALQVVVVRKGEVNYPQYAPLQLIDRILQIENNTLVADVINMSYDDLAHMARSDRSPHAVEHIEVYDDRQDIAHISNRLDFLGVGNHWMLKQPGGFQLHAVS